MNHPYNNRYVLFFIFFTIFSIFYFSFFFFADFPFREIRRSLNGWREGAVVLVYFTREHGSIGESTFLRSRLCLRSRRTTHTIHCQCRTHRTGWYYEDGCLKSFSFTDITRFRNISAAYIIYHARRRKCAVYKDFHKYPLNVYYDWRLRDGGRRTKMYIFSGETIEIPKYLNE